MDISLLTGLLGAIAGATIGIIGTRYVTMRTHRPTDTDALLTALRLAIIHATQMTQGTTVTLVYS